MTEKSYKAKELQSEIWGFFISHELNIMVVFAGV
jgi:hypothetical protein